MKLSFITVLAWPFVLAVSLHDMSDQTVITGTGLVSSLGLSKEETWKAVLEGRSGIKPPADDEQYRIMCRAAARVNGLSADSLHIHPRDARIMDSHVFMLMSAARQAFGDAGLDSAVIASEQTGFFAGMGMVDYNIDDLLPAVLQSCNASGELDYDRFFADAYQQIHPLWPLSMLNNIGFCQVAIDLGIKGENTTFSPHADSALLAVSEACRSISEKRADAVLAGGVSEKVSAMSSARAGWFDTLNTIDERCLPFGKDRSGAIPGEGAGIIVLERHQDAEARGIPAQAVIAGCGSSAASDSAPDAYSRAMSIAMKGAIRQAGLGPSDIDVVIAHGEGTVNGDAHEIMAINETFASSRGGVRVYSSKAALGNMLAGSPAIDIILGMNMIKHGIIPPVRGTYMPDNGIDFRLITGMSEKAEIKNILVHAFSPEGQCAALVLGPASEV